MTKIVSVHSFLRGTGKTNLIANIAALLTIQGRRVGVLDADIQSPDLHFLFDLDEGAVSYSLNDYLLGRCDIYRAAADVTAATGSRSGGKTFLIPSSTQEHEIARLLRSGYDLDLLNEGLQRLVEQLDLDLLLIDTHAGLSEETLALLAVSRLLVVVLRMDRRYYQGTAVTVEVARALGVPRLSLIANRVLPGVPLDDIKARVEETYHCEVAGVVPHHDEMLGLASSGLFITRFPNHPLTVTLEGVAARVLSSLGAEESPD